MIEIFDMDGVILDSLPAHVRFYIDFGKRHGIPISKEDVLRTSQGGTDNFFRLMGIPKEMEVVVAAEYHEQFHLYDCPIFPGIADVLRNLKRAGKTICLATLNRRKNVERLAGEVLPLFDFAVTKDDAYPKSDGLKMIVDRFGKPLNKYRLIGDSRWDVEDAARAGIGFLGVSWGWHELQKNDKYIVVSSPQELERVLLADRN